jgi:Phage phiEco32-like COOH.NH2 ligase-type 2
MIAVNKFKIGADPEYYAIEPDGRHRNVALYTEKEAPVAWDHKGDVLEVKPAPSRYAFRIVRRIKKLLLEHPVSQLMLKDDLRFRAGGRVKTDSRFIGLGGHIHLDIPYSDLSWGPQVERLQIVKTALEHMDILPKEDSSYRNRYSEVDLVRRANNADRVEYRGMCSWLHSPVTALLCLTAGKLVAAEPEHIPDKIGSVQELQQLFERFKSHDTDAARVCEKIFEPKLKLEARVDLNLEDTWKSLKKLGGMGSDEIGSAL